MGFKLKSNSFRTLLLQMRSLEDRSFQPPVRVPLLYRNSILGKWTHYAIIAKPFLYFARRTGWNNLNHQIKQSKIDQFILISVNSLLDWLLNATLKLNKEININDDSNELGNNDLAENSFSLQSKEVWLDKRSNLKTCWNIIPLCKFMQINNNNNNNNNSTISTSKSTATLYFSTPTP